MLRPIAWDHLFQSIKPWTNHGFANCPGRVKLTASERYQKNQFIRRQAISVVPRLTEPAKAYGHKKPNSTV
jgi:hypothetical protein